MNRLTVLIAALAASSPAWAVSTPTSTATRTRTPTTTSTFTPTLTLTRATTAVLSGSESPTPTATPTQTGMPFLSQTMTPGPQIQLSKSYINGNNVPGGQLTYVMTIYNPGPGGSYYNRLWDTMPAGTSYASSSPAPSAMNGDVATWDITWINPGAYASVTLTVNVLSYGMHCNQASAFSVSGLGYYPPAVSNLACTTPPVSESPTMTTTMFYLPPGTGTKTVTQTPTSSSTPTLTVTPTATRTGTFIYGSATYSPTVTPTSTGYYAYFSPTISPTSTQAISPVATPSWTPGSTPPQGCMTSQGSSDGMFTAPFGTCACWNDTAPGAQWEGPKPGAVSTCWGCSFDVDKFLYIPAGTALSNVRVNVIYTADDHISVTSNGALVASCTNPGGYSPCTEQNPFLIPPSTLQIGWNAIRFHVVDAWQGWHALSYSICWDLSGMATYTPTRTPTPGLPSGTGTRTITPTVTLTVTPTMTPPACAAALTPSCAWPAVYLPVCGCNGVTYGNATEAACHGITAYSNGACGGATPMPTATASPIRHRHPRLYLWGNRLRGIAAFQMISIWSEFDGAASVKVFNSRGRLVKALWQGSLGGGAEVTLTWNCDDDAGAKVQSGVYYVVFTDPHGASTRRGTALVR